MLNEQNKEFEKYTQFSLAQETKPKKFIENDKIVVQTTSNSDSSERNDNNRNSGNN